MTENNEILPMDLPKKLLGHTKEQKFLRTLYNNNRLGQAWIFCGEKGIGKSKLADELIRFIYSEDPQKHTLSHSLNIDPLDTVHRKYQLGSLRDFFVLKPEFDEKKKRFKTTISVKNARKVSQFYSTHASQTQAKKRICLIDDADFLNKEAANALLKIIEEPPQDALIIFIVHNITSLPMTIRSRCQTLYCRPLTHHDVQTIMSNIFSTQSQDALIPFVKAAKGVPGKAIIHYKQKDLFHEITSIINAFPHIDTTKITQLVRKFSDTDANANDNFEYASHMFADYLHERTMSVIDTNSELSQNFVYLERLIKLREKIITDMQKAINLYQNKQLIFFDFMHQIRNIVQ